MFVDTPGVFLGKKDKVSQRLNEFVKETLSGVDAIVYVTDPSRETGAEEELIQKMLRATNTPIIHVINKSDLPMSEKKALLNLQMVDVGQKETLELSALDKKNLNKLVDILFSIVQDTDMHYPDMQLTDIGHNQWLEELIREKIFLNLNEEIPYSIKISLDHAETRADGSRFLQATVWTTEERYKKMIIGSKASMIKKIGMDARKELEMATNTKIFLELTVKVDPKWQERFQ